MYGSSATTSATGSPTNRTTSRAMAGCRYRSVPLGAGTRLGMIAFAGTSAAVNTAVTPGRSRARLVSIETRRAWACGERSTAPCSMPGTRTSSTNRPLPLTNRSPPSLGCASPIMEEILALDAEQVPRPAGKQVIDKHQEEQQGQEHGDETSAHAHQAPVEAAQLFLLRHCAFLQGDQALCHPPILGAVLQLGVANITQELLDLVVCVHESSSERHLARFHARLDYLRDVLAV